MIELVRTKFKLRYNNSILGFVWVLLKPLMTFAVLYLIFSFFKAGWIENYQIYLLLGIIIFYLVNDGVLYGMKGILEVSDIILKVNFPREIAITSSEILAVINFLINMLVLIVFVLFNPISPTLISALYFLFIIIVLILLIYGVSLFTSIILVKLRDMEHITELIMQLLFYGTPIFYPIEMLPESIRTIVMLNPLTIIIQAARSALIYGEIEYLKGVIIIFGIMVLVLVTGSFYFRKNVKRIAEQF